MGRDASDAGRDADNTQLFSPNGAAPIPPFIDDDSSVFDGERPMAIEGRALAPGYAAADSLLAFDAGQIQACSCTR